MFGLTFWRRWAFDLGCVVVVAVAAVILTLDLFLHHGRPMTFDGPTHLTTMTQFYQGIATGHLPVVWGDGFGNYGMPIPLIAQQTTSYLGGIFIWLTGQVVLSYNLVFLVGAVLSAGLMYSWLRLWFSSPSALAGAILFNFAPYRIINIYMRGAVPEFWASCFTLCILIGSTLLWRGHRRQGAAILAAGVSLLVLTHPMMIIPSLLVMIPLWLGLWWHHRPQWSHLITIHGMAIGAGLLGLGASAYYLVPLLLEIKYFFYGSSSAHYIPGNFLSWANYFQPAWYYFTQFDVAPRGQYFHLGSVEMISLLAAVVTLAGVIVAKRTVPGFKWPPHTWLLSTTLITIFLVIYLTLPAAEPLYTRFTFLGNIQHPWRLLSALIILPPLLIAWLLDQLPSTWTLRTGTAVAVIILSAGLRIPQLYGKNYIYYPENLFHFTPINLHGTNLNLVWTGPTKDYPIRDRKYDILTGTGQVTPLHLSPRTRSYHIQANTSLRMVDYTFYYPGWEVTIDGTPTSIEFQDPDYRGVITYQVPAGSHQVELHLNDTKIRLLGKIISLGSLLTGLGVLLWWYKTTQK